MTESGNIPKQEIQAEKRPAQTRAAMQTTAPADAPSRTRPDATKRFVTRRDAIVDAASILINEHGVKGLSLADVAETIGLGSTSITYYFRRKEDLAAACFDRALDTLERQVTAAGNEPDLQSRVRRLVALSFASIGDLTSGAAHPVVRLTDLRATDDPIRAALVGRYFAIFRRARMFFGEGGTEQERLLHLMRTHVLLDNLYQLPSWLERYSKEEYGRVERRLVELFENGIARPGSSARMPEAIDPPLEPDEGGERFLGAATRLINERGYRGTSVEQIAARLNLTKGSFYHHLDAKDDLVLACFERSLQTITEALDLARAARGSRLDELGTALATLLARQLSGRTPLLRSTALLAMPATLRAPVIARSNHIARRFASLIIDGITEGTLPTIDPLIGGEVLMSTVDAAFELRDRASRVPLETAVALYSSTIFSGLLRR